MIYDLSSTNLNILHFYFIGITLIYRNSNNARIKDHYIDFTTSKEIFIRFYRSSTEQMSNNKL
jgi:hypothetical protein